MSVYLVKVLVSSKKVSLKLTEKLVNGHDSDVLNIKHNVEGLLKNEMSKRLRRTAAVQPGCGDFLFFLTMLGKS